VAESLSERKKKNHLIQFPVQTWLVAHWCLLVLLLLLQLHLHDQFSKLLLLPFVPMTDFQSFPYEFCTRHVIGYENPPIRSAAALTQGYTMVTQD
jgi:hypothetical protein